MEEKKGKRFFYRLFCGFFIGISIIAPGVSGSIMAVMMGIYDRLIDIISNPFKSFKKNVIYLFPMGIGAVLSIVLFIQIFNWMFEYLTIPAYLLFMGLIGGSLKDVFNEANKGKMKKRYIIAIVIAILFAAAVGMLTHVDVVQNTYSTNPLYFLLCGFIAGIVGMIPGMSVSMILMLLGVYQPMLDAVSKFEIITMLPVAVGFFAGMILLARFIKYLFKRFHSVAYFVVFGFMIGTLISIFPGLPQDALSWVLSIVMIAAGVGISVLFQKLGKKFNKSEEQEEPPAEIIG